MKIFLFLLTGAYAESEVFQQNEEIPQGKRGSYEELRKIHREQQLKQSPQIGSQFNRPQQPVIQSPQNQNQPQDDPSYAPPSKLKRRTNQYGDEIFE